MRSLAIVLGAVATLALGAQAHAGVPIAKPSSESLQTTLVQMGEGCFNRCMRTRCKRAKYPPACCSRICNRH